MKNSLKCVILFSTLLPLTACSKSFIVTFDSNGAFNVNSNTWTEKVKKGECAVKPLIMPKKHGYSFKFWTDDLVTEWAFGRNPIMKDTTLVAQYSVVTYQINLCAYCGEIPNTRIDYTIESETIVLPTPTPYASYSNYEFVSWKLNMSDYGEEDYVTVETLESKGIDINNITEIPQGTYGNLILEGVWNTKS